MINRRTFLGAVCSLLTASSFSPAASCYLTSAAPYSFPGSVYPIGRSLDHVAADAIEQTTPFSTLELSCNDAKDNIESIYFDNMSWYGPGHVDARSASGL